MTAHDDHPRDDVAAYALGALSDAEAKALERHLATCDPCARELERTRSVVDTLPCAAPRLRAPRPLKRRVMKTVREEAQHPARVALPRRPALVLAGGLAAAALAVGAYGLGATISGGEQIAAAVDADRVPGAGATLTVDGDVGVLRTEDLPRPQGVYVVWVDGGEGPRYASSFNVRPDGTGEAGIADLDGVERVMVTREASTSVTEPGEQPVLSVDLG